MLPQRKWSTDDSLAFPGISASAYKDHCKKSPGYSDQNKQKMYSLDFDHLQFFTDIDFPIIFQAKFLLSFQSH